MLEIKDATKIIKKKTILENINFKPESGKIYAIEGHNGSGKTMFLRLCCNLIRPTTGHVIINEGTTFGVLIENPGFMFNETAFNNLKYLADINKKIGKSEINEILKIFGLEDSKDIKVKKYSLGMIQKLGIAQAVMENPDIILLDEPFNALDKESVQTVKKVLLKQKDRGSAIIIASHELEIFKDCCDYIYSMNDGKLKLT